MSQCPVCEARVDADFGLVECESCGAQLLVHVDGRLEYQGAETKQVLGTTGPEEVPPAIETPAADFEFGEDHREVVIEVPPADPGDQPIQFDDPGIDPTQVSASDFGQAEHQENPFLQQIEAEANGAALADFSGDGNEDPPPMPTAVAFAADVEAMQRTATQMREEDDGDRANDGSLDGDGDFDGGGADADAAASDAADAPLAEYNFDEQGGQGAEPAPPVYNSAPADSSDLSDIARFGNSELSGSRDGALRYTLFIEGIDTTDVRAAFREAITDRKFVWDIDGILRSVRNGEVTIQNVAPSKAYMLISRLRNLPVKVRWEQYAISQT